MAGSTAVPRVVEPQRPLIPDDLEQVAAGQRQAGVEMREHLAREPHRRRERDVDAVAADLLLAHHALGLARDQAASAHAIAADVHQRPALELRAQADVRRVVRDEPEHAADHPEPADRAGADELGEPPGLRVVAVHEPSISSLSLRSATSKACSTSDVRRLSGFSHSTCLPASSARTVHSTCIEFGSEM